MPENAVIDTPLGPLLATADHARVTGLRFLDGTAPPDGAGAHGDELLETLARELSEYFRGERAGFSVVTDPAGTPFQRAVWDVLATIPYGATVAYRDIAESIARPRSTRAVAAAIGRNPVCIVTPCHRVIGADGSLTGYAGGLERKRELLALEGVRLG